MLSNNFLGKLQLFALVWVYTHSTSIGYDNFNFRRLRLWNDIILIYSITTVLEFTLLGF